MIYEDVVNGKIDLPHYITSIINTKQFQRLKKINQLGVYYAIYTRARHTRYDHSIGTYYEAFRMLDALERNTQNFQSTEAWKKLYRKAVEIAALLHDIGHGPFSHAWEAANKSYCHEDNSATCVDTVFSCLDKDILNEFRENDNYGIELIKALILGQPEILPYALPNEYKFIFEIVNNKQCQLDVDKYDYLKRDRHYLKDLCNPDLNFDDIFLKARVSEDGLHIQYRYEDYEKIYKLFEARMNFHTYCYRIPKNNYCEIMLQRIVENCKGHIFGKRLTEISAEHMDAFLELNDEKVLELAGEDRNLLTNIKQIEITDTFSNGYTDKNILSVKDRIEPAGEAMPPDERFHFFGDKNKKKKIVRCMEPIFNVGYFSLI